MYKTLEDLQKFSPGWNKLIEQWYYSIEEEDREKVLNKISYIKEKFWAISIEWANDCFFDELETSSRYCCSKCWNPWRTRYDLNWYQTLCNEHYEDLLK